VVPPTQSTTGGELAALTHAFAEIAFSTTAISETHSTWVWLPFVSGAASPESNQSGTTEFLATLDDLLNSAAGLNAVEQPLETPSLLEVPLAILDPHGAGLLTNAVAVDANIVKAGVHSFFNQLAQLDNLLNRSPAGINVYYWLLAAAAASSALLVVRRHLKRLAGGFVEGAAALDVGDPLFPWTPEGHAGPLEGPYA
jgi:hypothetical protein